MPKLKVLPSDYWMPDSPDEDDIQELDIRHKRVSPKFNRDGIYMQGKDCWFEACGYAWGYDRGMFLYKLSLHDAAALNHRQVAALQAVVDERLATKQQRELLHLCGIVARQHERRLDGAKFWRRFRKEHPEFLTEE